jgi:lysophospholipase L1-like esterase
MKEANEIIMDLAALHGMTVIDMAALMDNPDGRLKKELCTPDGVHFSDAGNNLWFETLRPYVLAVDPGL